MLIVEFLLNLAGATVLLLFAVRMVRTGIERAFGSVFRRVMTGTRMLAQAALLGAGLAAIMQSSLAVAMLVSGFVGAATLSFELGLPALLGADLGSALVVQFLSLEIIWLVPLLLLTGGLLFLKSDRLLLRQMGRVLLGIALILIALDLIRSTVTPIRESPFLPEIIFILERDFVTAFILGALLTFLMHSSVAAVLIFVALATVGALPLMVGISLMLGANLGASLLPVWMTRAMSPKARQVPVMNSLIRGGAALIMLVVLHYLPLLRLLPDVGPGQMIILAHILFNALLLLAVPFSALFGKWAEFLLPEPNAADAGLPAHYRSVLDRSVLDSPAPDSPVTDSPVLALTCIQREIQRMLLIVEEMILPFMDLLGQFDRERVQKIIRTDHHINKALNDIRLYAGDLAPLMTRASDRRQLRHMMEYAISIEAAGDIVSKNLLPLAAQRDKDTIRFSPEGLAELQSMHDRILANLALASNLLIADDVAIARRLVEEKNAFSRKQRKSRKRHLKRLAEGRAASLASSDLHLETSLAFKEFNSLIATIAYPILAREGQLLASRLVSEKPS